MKLRGMKCIVLSAVLCTAAGCGKAPESSALPAASAASQPTQELDGKSLYQGRCGMCHQGIGMAVSLLARRPGDTSNGLLEERKDLSPELVIAFVRTGAGNMPRIARGEVSDPEMTAIASYLAQSKP